MPDPPAELAGCAPAPAVYAADADEAAIAEYLVRLDFAGADCRRTLAELVDWLAAAKGRIEAPPDR